jgi:coenzyme F420 biosynthesis associated uncharacterized protein
MGPVSEEGSISWAIAARFAERVARREPFSLSYLAGSAKDELSELTMIAEEHVALDTGLHVDAPAAVDVVDRPGWVATNISMLRHVIAPLMEASVPPARGLVAKAARSGASVEVGALLGWVSSRVLGQYLPALGPDPSTNDDDVLLYVLPNVLQLEKRYAFPPREFRLWIALHECTHRAQFQGVDWLGPYMREQLAIVFGTAAGGTRRLDVARLLKDRAAVASAERPSAPPLVQLLDDTQRAALSRLQALMALLEGHSDVVMSRAGGVLVPSSERFARVMHHRRTSARGVTRFAQRIIGLDSKLRQYEDGAVFVRSVEAAGGRAAFERVWSSAESLPTVVEISEPTLWLERTALV